MYKALKNSNIYIYSYYFSFLCCMNNFEHDCELKLFNSLA